MPEPRAPRGPRPPRRGRSGAERPRARTPRDRVADPAAPADAARPAPRRGLRNWVRRLDGPVRLGAALVLAGAVAGIGLVPNGLEPALRSDAVGERGVYDLLVRALPSGNPADPRPSEEAGDAEESAGDDTATFRASAAETARDEQVDADDEPAAIRFPPNTTLAPGAPRLSRGDLAAIRDVPGVGIAAPVSRLAATFYQWSGQRFAVPVAVGQPDVTPEAFRVRLSMLDDNGTGERPILMTEFAIVVDRSDRAPSRVLPPEAFGEDEQCVVGDVTLQMTDPEAEVCRTVWESPVSVISLRDHTTTNGAGERVGDWIVFDVTWTPSIGGTLTLVDPVAESALLGDAGGFLDPLSRIGDRVPGAAISARDIEAWEADAPGEPGPELDALLQEVRTEAGWFADSLDGSPVRFGEEDSEASLEELRAGIADPGQAKSFDTMVGQPILPLVVATEGGRGPRLELDIDGFGAAPVAGYDQGGWNRRFELPDALEQGGDGTPLGTLDVEAARTLGADPAPLVRWPGYDEDAERELTSPDELPRSSLALDSIWLPALPPAARTGGSGADEAADPTTLHAVGRARESGWTALDGVVSVGDLVFGSRTPLAFDPVDESLGQLTPRTVIVGRVDADVLSVDGVGAAPLGAFRPGVSTWIRDARGDAVTPLDLPQSERGDGLSDSGTRIIAPLEAVARASSKTPLIDSIRVRVDAPGTNADAAAAIAAVADRLEQLGFEVIPVAGAVRIPVELGVEDWLFPTTMEGSEALGTIRQEWTEIPTASLSAADANGIAAVAAATAAGLALLVLAHRFHRRRRRRAAEVLAALGAHRRRLLARAAAAWALPFVVVLVGVELAVAAAPGIGMTMVLASTAVGGVLAIAAWSVGVEVHGIVPASRPAPDGVAEAPAGPGGASAVGAFASAPTAPASLAPAPVTTARAVVATPTAPAGNADDDPWRAFRRPEG